MARIDPSRQVSMNERDIAKGISDEEPKYRKIVRKVRKSGKNPKNKKSLTKSGREVGILEFGARGNCSLKWLVYNGQADLGDVQVILDTRSVQLQAKLFGKILNLLISRHEREAP